jgi:hypothetical protein
MELASIVTLVVIIGIVIVGALGVLIDKSVD